MGPSPKSLILDLLSTVRRGSVPVRALVDAAQLFGIAENSLRVALARLHGAGLAERDERGQYTLGAAAQAVNRQVTAWRSTEARMRPWRGGWVGVQSSASSRSDRPALRRRARALRLLGFRELVQGLELRPDNLSGGIAAVRSQLYALGLEPTAMVLGLADLDADTESRARGLWDIESLDVAYDAMRRELEQSSERLARMGREAAMVESFLCGGRVLRLLVQDPLLPEPIASAARRRALVTAMRHYDRLGRACWAGQLGVSHSAQPHTPTNQGMLSTPGQLTLSATGATT